MVRPDKTMIIALENVTGVVERPKSIRLNSKSPSGRGGSRKYFDYCSDEDIRNTMLQEPRSWTH